MEQEKIERWRYPRFFTENISETAAVLDQEDSRHVAQVLRMKPGDIAVICDGKGTDYLAELESSVGECVFRVLESSPNQAEPNVHVRLFQAMPKGDKMDFIVQKAVECGACEVIPFLSKRCISRPDKKQLAKKRERWQRIAYEAAKQCGRGVIPTVGETLEFSQLTQVISPQDTRILFYECADVPLREAVAEYSGNVDIVIGSEGGFAPEEAERLVQAGFVCASLGKRILRCETAPIAAISVLMNMTGNI